MMILINDWQDYDFFSAKSTFSHMKNWLILGVMREHPYFLVNLLHIFDRVLSACNIIGSLD